MTAGKALELADQMRPNNDFRDEMKQMWLRQCDARLRQTVVNRSACGDFDAVRHRAKASLSPFASDRNKDDGSGSYISRSSL